MRLWAKLNDWMLAWQTSAELAADARRQRIARRQQMRRHAMPWMLWLLVVAGGFVAVPSRTGVDWAHAVLTVASVPPLVALGWLRMREVLAGDELEQRIELLAMGMTFTAALCILLLLSLLDAFEVPVRLPPLLLFYVFFLGYQLILRLVRARYQ